MLSLIRYRQNETSIFGNLYLNGAFVCFTLENKREAIPGGIYKVENSQSPKFGRELPLLYNDEVPAKRGTVSSGSVSWQGWFKSVLTAV